jgi:HEAT repeat protein
MPSEAELDTVGDFLRRWNALPNKQRYRIAHEIPIAEMQTTAVLHPDPWIRRGCLFFLDHYANEGSTTTFLTALDDPVSPVRAMALHGLACEQCRNEELCVSDVVLVLSRVLASDPSPDIRHKAIPILLRLSDRDPRAKTAIEGAATSDEDPLVRHVAVAALEGRARDASRSRHDLLRASRTRRGKKRNSSEAVM